MQITAVMATPILSGPQASAPALPQGSGLSRLQVQRRNVLGGVGGCLLLGFLCHFKPSLSHSDQQHFPFWVGHFVCNAEAFCGIKPILANCHRFLPGLHQKTGNSHPSTKVPLTQGRKPSPLGLITARLFLLSVRFGPSQIFLRAVCRCYYEHCGRHELVSAGYFSDRYP
jgi:hypothetical protein